MVCDLLVSDVAVTQFGKLLMDGESQTAASIWGQFPALSSVMSI